MRGPFIQPLPASGVEPEMLNDDFPVSFDRFAPRLLGTPEEIWLHWLRTQHGREKHSERGWFALIDQYRNKRA